MEVSGKPHALSTFSHPAECWVGPKARLDVLVNRETCCTLLVSELRIINTRLHATFQTASYSRFTSDFHQPKS